MDSTVYTRRVPKLTGTNFETWREEMMLFLTMLDMARFLKEDAPTTQPEDSDELNLARMQAWNHGDFECRNQILYHLSFPLYVMFTDCRTSKELWDAIDKTFDIGGIYQPPPAKKAKVDGPNVEKEEEDVPRTVEEALQSKEAPYWREAIRNELTELRNDMDGIMWKFTWGQLEDVPEKVPLGYRWCLRKKITGDGTAIVFKASLRASHFRIKESHM